MSQQDTQHTDQDATQATNDTHPTPEDTNEVTAPQEDTQPTDPTEELDTLRAQLKDAEEVRNRAIDIANGAIRSAVGDWLAKKQLKRDLMWTLGHTEFDFINDTGEVDTDLITGAILDYEKKTGLQLVESWAVPESPNQGMTVSGAVPGDWSGFIKSM